MPYDNNDRKVDSVYSKRIRAGKRRTYFFDVRATRGNDYYLTITESRKRPNDDGYDRHKIFLYKEDFNKFSRALTEAVDYVKTDLMPDFDFDAFNHEYSEDGDFREHRDGMPHGAAVVDGAREIAASVPVLPDGHDTQGDHDENRKADGHDGQAGGEIRAAADGRGQDEAEKW